MKRNKNFLDIKIQNDILKVHYHKIRGNTEKIVISYKH